jgi:glycosyltransferase involved in cell wall biosynthesis
MPSPFKLLIVCWDFPPRRAIGGRRWSKMAKSFLRQGHQVSVISASEKSKDKLPPAWISESDLEKIRGAYINPGFLTEWLTDYSSRWSGVKIRIARLILLLVQRGTVFDKSLGRKNEIQSKIRSILSLQNYDAVFVTGAPFNLFYYTALIRNEFPRVKFIADYRDPWIGAENYGMKELSPMRSEFEIQKQNMVFEKFNFVSAPNEFLLEDIRRSYTGRTAEIAKFVTLPHAFDPEDLAFDPLPLNVERKEIKIVYAGTLYLGLEKVLEKLNGAVEIASSNGNNLSVELYTDDNIPSGLRVEQLTLKKPVGNRIFKEMESADYILILLAEHNKDFLTSKFFEFLPLRKPFLYLGPEGYVSRTIINEKLGEVITKKEDLVAILRHPPQFPVEADIKKYTFDMTSRRFLDQILPS